MSIRINSNKVSPLPLSERLKAILFQASNDPERAALTPMPLKKAISQLRTYLHVAAEDWPERDFTEMVLAELEAIKQHIPPEFEPVRQAMVTECGKTLEG